MQNLVPTRRPVLDFTPVPRKYRVDGWTPDRQRAFIVALAATGSVKSAAHRINMSPEGAYYLRRQPGAESFRRAWDAALDHGVQSLRDIAMDRAREGVPQPIVHAGEVVGEKRVYDNRLLMFLIRRNDQLDGLAPGTKSEARLAQEADDSPDDAVQARIDRLVAERLAQEEEEAATIRARLTARFEEMEERLLAEHMEDWTEAEREEWRKDRQRGVAPPIRPVVEE